MAEIEELREQLDEVDRKIADLFEQRMQIGRELGACKLQNGIKMIDRQRERDKLADMAGRASTEFNKKGIRELFEQMMSMNRKVHYQQMVEAGALGRLPFIGVDSLHAEDARIVFQGMEGAYSQAAMRCYFGENCNSFYVPAFRDAMESIEEGAADFAVLPIENSTAGSVDEMYDLLVEFENYIVGETIIPITHTLAGLPGTRIAEIERVYSKGIALMQASRFLNEHSEWQQISVANTAIAARKIREEQDKSQAAVCSAYAAKVQGLEVLADNINDNPNN